MAANSGQFKAGNTLGGRRKGVPNKLTNDQRMIFDEAISPKDRVQLVKMAFKRAMLGDKDSANYTKLLFDFVFARPRQGHEVAIPDMSEVMTPEVCEGVWREIMAEARERDAADQRRRGGNGSQPPEVR